MKKTDQEYKQSLSDIEYRVTRQAATERPFTEVLGSLDKGRYKRIRCDTPLFYRKPNLMQAVVGPATTHPVASSIRRFGMPGMVRFVPRSAVPTAMPI
jgi:peptide-methionine (R)-S-oxide reductase